MNKLYDVIVIGLGIMGAAALWRSSMKFSRTLGIEAAGPTHWFSNATTQSPKTVMDPLCTA